LNVYPPIIHFSFIIIFYNLVLPLEDSQNPPLFFIIDIGCVFAVICLSDMKGSIVPNVISSFVDYQ